jgi:hypothetical protein
VKTDVAGLFATSQHERAAGQLSIALSSEEKTREKSFLSAARGHQDAQEDSFLTRIYFILNLLILGITLPVLDAVSKTLL